MQKIIALNAKKCKIAPEMANISQQDLKTTSKVSYFTPQSRTLVT